MKKFLTLNIALLCSVFARAATYSTLSNGSWSDNTSVWSLNGSSPCGCNPATHMNDQIIVSHDIVMDNDLTVEAGGSLTLNSGARLGHVEYQLSVTGSVINNGYLMLKSIKNNTGGSIVSSGEILVVQGPTINDGSFIVNGPMTMQQGTFDNQTHGYFAIGAGIKVMLSADDGFNKGVIEFMGGGACLSVFKKNFYNQAPGGEMRGSGGVYVEGDINNHGLWESGVDWCANGVAKGSKPMPPENCSGSCGVVYPVVLASFRADVRAGFVNLSWTTFAENGTDYFGIEKRVIAGPDGSCKIGSCSGESVFEEIARVDAKGSGPGRTQYYYTDKQTETGINLYRLRIQDVNDRFIYSPVVSVSIYENQPGLLIYPNPNNEELHIRITGEPGAPITLEIYDITGRRVWNYNSNLTAGMQEVIYNVCDLASGTYIVKYKHKAREESAKLVVQK